MKLNLKMLKQSLTILMMVIFANSYAQVGINTTTPHPSAALEINSDDGGILIPRMSTAARDGIPNPSNSLMVYDTDFKLFFFYQNGQWYPISAFKTTLTPNGGTTDSVTYIHGKVGIGIATPAERLHVLGNIKVNGAINATGNITTVGNISTTANVYATNIYGQGTVPTGAIIMWSGSISSIPSGWALCDGSMIILPNGSSYTTPNLKGKFIVGYDNSMTAYNTPGNTGGNNQIILSGNQLPIACPWNLLDNGHTHSYGDYVGQSETLYTGGSRNDKNNNNNIVDIPRVTGRSQAGIIIQANASGGQPIDVRPSYFVVAYLIKLPY